MKDSEELLDKIVKIMEISRIMDCKSEQSLLVCLCVEDPGIFRSVLLCIGNQG